MEHSEKRKHFSEIDSMSDGDIIMGFVLGALVILGLSIFVTMLSVVQANVEFLCKTYRLEVNSYEPSGWGLTKVECIDEKIIEETPGHKIFRNSE